MAEKSDLERVLLAVDVASLWDTCRAKYGREARLNFEVLKNVVPAIRGGIDKVNMTSVAYIVTHKKATHLAFSKVLTALDFAVKSTEVKYFDPTPPTRRVGSINDDWTVGISVDAVHWADKYDTFVLAAGAKPFEKLLQHLRERGKNVIVLTFENPRAKLTFEPNADEVLYLTKDIIY